MADDFKVGDVVVCVNDGPPSGAPHTYMSYPHIPKLHSVHKISGIMLAPDGVPGVLINGWPPAQTYSGPSPYGMHRFRHLPKADDTFIQQMRSLKPARTRESAR